MKKFLILVAFLSLSIELFAEKRGVVVVNEPFTPLMVNSEDNLFMGLSVKPVDGESVLESVELSIDNKKYIKKLSLYYTGTRSFVSEANFNRDYLKDSYAIKKFETYDVKSKMKIDIDQKLFAKGSSFYLAVTLDENTPLTERLSIEISSAVIDGREVEIEYKGAGEARRMAVSLRNGGDDGVSAYRIPGLVTTKKGTLIAVYDVRRNSAADLQEDIQVGMSRSFDGGATWQPMQIVIDMRGYGSLPDSQNGVGDPAVLVDDVTGDIFVVGLWSHGLGGIRNFWGTPKNSMAPEEEAAQVVMVRSSDDGATWSAPHNITPQIRDSRWGVMLQGPGMGITMKDGTLVFPFQYLDSDNLPKATIIYSKDRGENWKVASPARDNTTEAQVAEVEPGVLMLNMRDNRGGSRAIYTSSDMGVTWNEHNSSRSALIEPVCMASFIKVDDNRFLFSNPADKKSRVNMTIKASSDGAKSWNSGLLLDSNPSWGYSCMSVVDSENIGILYEGSQSQMTFQIVPLKELFDK